MLIMTIGSTSPARVSFNCDGITKVFPVPIQAYQNSDLTVILTAPASAGGAETTLVLNSDYSLTTSGTLQPTAWTLTTLAAAPYAAGYTLQVFINPVQQQQTQYVQGQAFPSLAVQTNLDRLTQMVQRLQDQVSRSVRAPDGDVSPGMLMPPAGLRISMYLATDANGNLLFTQALPGTANTQASLGPILYPRTTGEINALPTPVNPVNFIYPAQVALRYGNNTVPGTTAMDSAIQAAIDSANQSSAEVVLADENGLSKPLLIRSTTQQSISLRGNARVATMLLPLAASIATGPVNVNALIICQNNNAHLHLKQLRFLDAAAFTGVFMYALNGGGADASVRASFSMVVDDCWFSPSSNNSGCFQGTYSNLQMINCVFESIKTGCLRLSGNGCSDILLANITLNACFDSLVFSADDTIPKALLTVTGVHAYQHFRGPIFQLNNWNGVNIRSVIVQANVAQISGVGIAVFQDCTGVDLAGANCHSITGAPQGAGPAITIANGFTGKISNVVSDCLTGVLFTGAGVVNAEFDNCDFSGTLVQAPVLAPVTTSTTGGTLAAATYYYKITSLGTAGETVGSNEQSVTTVGGSSSNALTWSAVPGAVSHRVYRGTAPGAENVFYAAGGVTSFVDTGAASTGGTPPVSSTAVTPINAGVQISASTQSGVATFRRCKFNFASLDNFLHSSGANTMTWYFIDCELLNAGVGGNTGNRNIGSTLAGNLFFNQGCKIGQNSALASAQYYMDLGGAGQFFVTDPQIIGVAPVGLITPGSTQAPIWDGIDSNTPNFTNVMGLTPGGTVALGATVNRWSLKGRIVNFYADITITTIGTGSQTSMSGLPFTSSATMYGGAVVHFFSGSASNVVDLQVSVPPAGTSVALRSLLAAGAGTANNNILQNGTRIIMAGSYPLT